MRVVLADDEALLREGLARLLVEAGFEVSGTAQDAAGLLRLVEARRPDVAITDIKMPPNHTDEGLHRRSRRSAAAFPTSASWCSRTIWNRATRCRSSRSSRNARATS